MKSPSQIRTIFASPVKPKMKHESSSALLFRSEDLEAYLHTEYNIVVKGPHIPHHGAVSAVLAILGRKGDQPNATSETTTDIALRTDRSRPMRTNTKDAGALIDGRCCHGGDCS